MGRKMSLLPSLFRSTTDSGQPWQWPSCKQPKTLSFRATDDIIKTVNSVYFDPAADDVETPESWFTNSSESASFSTESEDWFGGEAAEVVIRGVQSERLFFKPGCTSSILEEAKAEEEEEEKKDAFPFEESVALAMESEDPYMDFRRSMEEMVESHGLKDWERLEELLGWYLKVNGKVNHGFIIGAFVDLLVGIASSSSSTSDVASSFSSAASSFSDPSSPMSASDHRKEVDDVESGSAIA